MQPHLFREAVETAFQRIKEAREEDDAAEKAQARGGCVVLGRWKRGGAVSHGCPLQCCSLSTVLAMLHSTFHLSALHVQAEALEAAKAEGKDMGADLVLYKRMAQVRGRGRAAASARLGKLLQVCCCWCGAVGWQLRPTLTAQLAAASMPSSAACSWCFHPPLTTWSPFVCR